MERPYDVLSLVGAEACFEAFVRCYPSLQAHSRWLAAQIPDTGPYLLGVEHAIMFAMFAVANHTQALPRSGPFPNRHPGRN